MHFTCLGAGNVATHLSKALSQAGHSVCQVFSRSLSRAALLCEQVGGSPVCDLTYIEPGADLYIIAVHDDAISSVAQQLQAVIDEQAVVVHTSGAAPMQVLSQHFDAAGVFYPLQTISQGRSVDFRTVPLCLHATNEQVLSMLQQLAQQLSDHVYLIDDKQRSAIHVTAVFINNFANHCFHIGADLCQSQKLDFALFHALIRETAEKAIDLGPQAAQTGPALRADDKTLQKHLHFLQEHAPHRQSIYQALSRSIQQQQDKT